MFDKFSNLVLFFYGTVFFVQRFSLAFDRKVVGIYFLFSMDGNFVCFKHISLKWLRLPSSCCVISVILLNKSEVNFSELSNLGSIRSALTLAFARERFTHLSETFRMFSSFEKLWFVSSKNDMENSIFHRKAVNGDSISLFQFWVFLWMYSEVVPLGVGWLIIEREELEVLHCISGLTYDVLATVCDDWGLLKTGLGSCGDVVTTTRGALKKVFRSCLYMSYFFSGILSLNLHRFKSSIRFTVRLKPKITGNTTD